MKKAIALPILLGTVACALAAKPELKPYGFIKGDMYYSTAGITSWGQNAITASSRATGDTTTMVAFSAQHSRFGLKGKADVGDITIGGRLELDFFSASSNTNANANPRMRLAYAWLKPIPAFELRVGQQWDLFSPLNPTTNNTNANLWYNGNYGFRRPQFQLRYTMGEKVKPSLYVSVGEGAKEATGAGKDNLSMLPMMQGRLGVDLAEKAQIGVSGLYAAFGEDRDYAASGVSLDLTVPVGEKFSIKGEYAYGINLNDANIFTTAGSKVQTGMVDTVEITDDRARVTSGFWANAIYKPVDFLHVVGGFAMETNLTEDLGKVPGITDMETNTTFYGDLIFPIGEHFSLAVEYQHLLTTIAGDDETKSAGVIDVAGKVVF